MLDFAIGFLARSAVMLPIILLMTVGVWLAMKKLGIYGSITLSTLQTCAHGHFPTRPSKRQYLVWCLGRSPLHSVIANSQPQSLRAPRHSPRLAAFQRSHLSFENRFSSRTQRTAARRRTTP